MISLIHGVTNATVNPEGAWVESLTANGEAVLFPKSELTNEAGESKARGGMHVCLPNFGPGGDSGLAQHGFGRTSLWQIAQQDASSASLELKAPSAQYNGLEATLTYQLGDNSLSADLSLTNAGGKPLRVAPGFHPYFALNESETVVNINGKARELSTLADAEFIGAETIELATAERTIHLSQTNLTTWAIWTDKLGNYVCVEPTFGGYRFLEAEQSDENLLPDQTRTYSVRIRW